MVLKPTSRRAVRENAFSPYLRVLAVNQLILRRQMPR